MDKTTMLAMLESLSISTNTWLTDKSIFIIGITSDGNFHNDFFSERLNFDTVNDLVRVKFYSYKLGTSQFFKAEQVTVNSFKASRDELGHYGKYLPINEKLGRMRNPAIGDIVYTVNASGDFVAAVYISSIDGTTLTLSGNLTIGTNRVCYADGSIIKIQGGLLESIKDGSYLEELTDMTSILYREALTIYNTDLYLDFNNINSFSLVRYKV